MSYRVDPRQPLTLEVRRIAGAEIEAALEQLARAHQRPDEAFHECRKRLKSLRALLRLIRSGDEAFARAENARYRDVAARLAMPREAAALVETVDRIAAEFRDSETGEVLASVRDNLVARRGAILDEGLSPVIDSAAESCRAGLRRLETIRLPDHPDSAADILADGLRKTMRRARKALERARSRGEPGDFHDLRKAVKTHAKHLALLRRFWPSPVKARIKSLDALGLRLGDLNDLFVLRALARDGAEVLGSRAETRQLDKLAQRSERKLRKSCIAAASELFHDKPGRSAKKVARNVRRDLADPVTNATA